MELAFIMVYAPNVMESVTRKQVNETALVNQEQLERVGDFRMS